MAEIEISEKKSVSKIIIIVLLSLILLLTATILFFVVFDKQADNIFSIFKSESGEFTAPLEVFVVNLKPEGNVRHYIKVSLALMFTNEDDSKIIETNMSKIRDTIISTLRAKTYNDIVNDNQTLNLKTELIESINKSLNESIVEGVYITDVIIQ